MERIKGLLAFYWDKVDHWFEEDEAHACDGIEPVVELAVQVVEIAIIAAQEKILPLP